VISSVSVWVDNTQCLQSGKARFILLTLFCCLPSIFASIVLPSVFVPFFVGLTAVLSYITFKNIQDELFELDQKEVYFFITVPLYFICLGWAGLLILNDNGSLVVRCVGDVFVLLVLCILPVYRFKNAKKERKIPFKRMYFFGAGLVVLHQILFLAVEVIAWFTE
jgi:amino acid permease